MVPRVVQTGCALTPSVLKSMKISVTVNSQSILRTVALVIITAEQTIILAMI